MIFEWFLNPFFLIVIYRSTIKSDVNSDGLEFSPNAKAWRITDCFQEGGTITDIDLLGDLTIWTLDLNLEIRKRMASPIRGSVGISGATLPEGVRLSDSPSVWNHQRRKHVWNSHLWSSLCCGIFSTNSPIQIFDWLIHYYLDDVCAKHYITDKRYVEP